MKSFEGQKSTQHTIQQMRAAIQTVVSKQLGREAPEVRVELDPNDPSRVIVSTPVPTPAKFIKLEF